MPGDMTDSEMRRELEHDPPGERLEGIRDEIEAREKVRGRDLTQLRTLAGLPRAAMTRH